MNRKNKIIVVIVSILLVGASLWYFFADDLLLFILSRVVPPAEPMPAEQRMPCGGNPAGFVELGSPYEGGKIAEFTTSGNEIYITARKFEHAGIFGSFRGSTAINVGDIDKFTIVIYLEGEDPDCLNNIIGGEIKMRMDIREEHVDDEK